MLYRENKEFIIPNENICLITEKKCTKLVQCKYCEERRKYFELIELH